MSTISVPLNAELLQALQLLIDRGLASSKADAIRKALQKYIEDQEVEDILKAHVEPRLDGDLDTLASQLS